MGMTCPGRDDPLINSDSLLHCFCPRLVIRGGVGFFRTLGCCDQMEDRVIGIPKLDFAEPKLVQDDLKFLIIHVGFIVQGAPVADDQDLVRLHA